MINKELMDLLFEEQEATNKKKFWVFFRYINRTPSRKIGKQDRKKLCEMFNVSAEFVEDAIKKSSEEKLNYFKKSNPPIEKIFRGGLNPKRFEELLDKE